MPIATCIATSAAMRRDCLNFEWIHRHRPVSDDGTWPGNMSATLERRALLLVGSSRHAAMNAARSSSLIGLQAVSIPSPNTRKGLPRFTRLACPDRDLKNAVGRTMDHREPRVHQHFFERQLRALKGQQWLLHAGRVGHARAFRGRKGGNVRHTT